MLGRFLEIGIATADIRASVEFYERLGLTQARTGDIWPHPYGVLTDGRVYLGLHQSRLESPALTFVRPGIAGHAVTLQRLGIELSGVNIGSEAFNELAFRDPAGQPVRLLEARTYSPADPSDLETSRCGTCGGLSIPAADFEQVSRFWRSLGLEAAEEETQPYAHLPLRGGGLGLALHRPRFFAEPLLVFRDAAMAARIARLRELGVGPLEPPPRGLDPRGNALLTAPEGTVLALLQDPSPG
ncbi:MAG TPA: VOC family protein [Steroidobacteraceae bacterium]|nr:VOC family protein [Steroidobacteraceae bacterium]